MDFTNAKIRKIVTHYVGNKLRTEKLVLSSKQSVVDECSEQSLLTYFFSAFGNTGYYKFYNTVELAANEVYNIANRIFAGDDFIKNSKLLGKLLYDCSLHPKIKAGEFHVVLFDDVLLDNQLLSGIGLYKSETKGDFLKFNYVTNHYEIVSETGFSNDDIDKGCIIFNTDGTEGYKIAIVDRTNKVETQYWNDDFLQIIARADEYHHTADYLAAAKDFIVKQIPQEYEVTKAQQADYLNRSIAFFRNNDAFNEKAFVSEVFEDKELIQSFSGYKRTYEQDHEMELEDNFSISGQAVKRSARIFKSVIKLDKNFHVYVHGDRDLIERGYDEAVGKHYYKIYFDNES